MSLSVGIFPGSFDPVHIGHLALANYLCEYEELDEVWFLLTPQNPKKSNGPAFSDHQRLSWVQAAVRDYPRFKVSDIELHLPKPTYTILTLRALQQQHPDVKFSLIVGADNWIIFDQWKDSDKLLEEFELIVYPRKGYECADSNHPGVHFSQAPLIEISSSFIRKAYQEGRDLRFFLPERVKM